MSWGVWKIHNNKSRKKNTKKGNKDQVINTRIRTTIKEQIRTKYSEDTWSKDKYDPIKQYQNKTSKLSNEIFRDKRPDLENGQKMMMRMIHGALPTYEKINRLIIAEQHNSNGKSNYYTNKYEKSANDGMCPCCREQEETVKHLFHECTDDIISEMRTKLPRQINKAICKHVEDVYVSTNFIKPQTQNAKWDSYLATMGLIPNDTAKEILDQLEDGQKGLLKRIIADISNNIMDINIEIWKYRCKLLFRNREEVT